jgi:hypothetical protein
LRRSAEWLPRLSRSGVPTHRRGCCFTLAAVLNAQGATIEVQHVLQPLVVVMAGAGEIDPYKD